jgi:hypothetical protein
MELPKRLPAKTEHRRILGEFYDFNKNMKPTIEIYCTYNPVLEMKDILQFCDRYNVAHEIIAFSHQG